MKNIKHFARTAAFALGQTVFPIKPKPSEETFDIEAHIERVQASFRNALNDDLKKSIV